MKSLDCDLDREFLVQKPGINQPVELLFTSTGNLLPEQGDVIDLGARPEAEKLRAYFETCVFQVQGVMLQPGWGSVAGKLPSREPSDWRPDRAVVCLSPCKGLDFSATLAKCLERPQMSASKGGIDKLEGPHYLGGTEHHPVVCGPGFQPVSGGAFRARGCDVAGAA